MPPVTDPKDTLQKVLKWWDQDKRSHADRCSKYKRGYSAYEGTLDFRSSAAAWTHKLTPRYAFQVIETIKAALLDPHPQFRLRPRPRMASPEEIGFYRAGVKANEILLNEQLDEDKFIEKQGPFALQGLICGLTIGKCYWDHKEGPRTRQQTVAEVPHYDAFGGVTAMKPVIDDVTAHEIEYSRPTFEVVDVFDFVWHEAAVSLDKAMRVHHRCYYTFDELKELESQELYQNVDELKESRDWTVEKQDRPDDLFAVDKAKDMIEVVETWYRTRGGMRYATVANRKVLLADRETPFWHGQYPFVGASSAPGPFRIPGTSEVELMEEIQSAMWSFLNQSLDNLALMNNGVLMAGPEVEDPDDLQFFPGAVNLVNNPAGVQWLRPEGSVTQMAMPWLATMKDDLQNVPGASDTLQGQVSPGTQTATEVSSLTTMAMRRVQAKKAQYALAHKRKGELDIEMNQQFVRDDQVVAVVGPGDEYDFRTVSPLEIQGRYKIIVDPIDDSMVKQERMAQATSRFQVMLQAAPVFAAIHQGEMQAVAAGQADPKDVTPMLNLRAAMDDVLEAGGIDDVDRYYMKPAPAAAQQVAQQGQSGQGQPPQNGGAPPAGLTAPQASDTSSPSNAISQSPEAAMQRLMAMRGGPQNAQ